jgi:sugar phosphate isomerase/epimerase
MHPRLCVHAVSFPVTGFSDLLNCWRDVGAHRVSLSSYQILNEDLAAARQSLDGGGLALECITHPFLGPHPLEAREASWLEPRKALNQVIDAAKVLGARSIYMLSGGHGLLTWEDAASVFRDAIAPCVEHAKASGIKLAVENSAALYTDIHLAHTLRDTVTLAEIAGVGVCMDFFACWAEAGLRESIARALPRCHLVQVCDYADGDRSLPSRAVPGDGAIPIQRILDWTLQAGYTGYYDLELVGPRIVREGPVAAVRRGADVVGEMLRALGA